MEIPKRVVMLIVLLLLLFLLWAMTLPHAARGAPAPFPKSLRQRNLDFHGVLRFGVTDYEVFLASDGQYRAWTIPRGDVEWEGTWVRGDGKVLFQERVRGSQGQHYGITVPAGTVTRWRDGCEPTR